MRQSFPGFIRLWNPSAKCFESFALQNDRCFSFENQNISNISSMLEGSKVVSFPSRYRFSFTDPFATIRFFRDFFLFSKKKKPTNIYRKQRKEFKIASDKIFYFFRFRSGTVRDHCSKHTWKQSQSQLKLTSFQKKKKKPNSWINKTLKKQNKCNLHSCSNISEVPTISLPCVI